MKDQIEYPDFEKLDIRVATVTAAEEIEGADKLLKLTLDVGELGERTVASGIKEWFRPEDLVGKSVIYLANLAPRMLRGIESQGMILAAEAEQPVLLEPAVDVPAGSAIR